MTMRIWLIANCQRALLPLLLVAVWELLVRFEVLPPSQSAAPSVVGRRLVDLVSSGVLIGHGAYSILRLYLGVTIGAGFAIFISVLLPSSRTTERLLSPAIQLLAGVPVVLWMPFCVMLFGIGETYKVSLTAISSFFLVQVLTYQAVRSTERVYLELAAIYEKGYWATVRHVYLPSAAPAIFTSVRAALGLGWVILFFVEFAASTQGTEGLGWFIADTRAVGRIEDEFAGLFFLAILAFLTDKAVALWQGWVLVWMDTGTAS